MAKTRGEGRSPAEKKQRVLETGEARRARIAKMKAEQSRFDELAGPVIVTQRED